MNLRHLRAVDYLFEAIAGSVCYTAALMLFGLTKIGKGFRCLQPLLFPLDEQSAIFVLLATLAQLLQDNVRPFVVQEGPATRDRRGEGR